MSESEARTTDERASHTPGPWRLNKYGSIGAGQYGTLPIVATIELLEGPDQKYGNHAANARLIAAAPDLLALAKQYASECAGCGGSGVAETFEDNVPGDITKGVRPAQMDCPDCADIRAVIAKAEGRS